VEKVERKAILFIKTELDEAMNANKTKLNKGTQEGVCWPDNLDEV
jgi:hypothetical protein